MRIPPKPPPLKQDTPIAPVGVFARSRTGEVVPVEMRYDGKHGRFHHWRSVDAYRVSEVFKVGWQWLPPLTKVFVNVRP